MIKRTIDFIANDSIREILFAFILVIITIEYISGFFVRILLFIIAFAIAIKPCFRKSKENKNETNKKTNKKN